MPVVLVWVMAGCAWATELSDHNVGWDSPSANALASMPCGGGDVGLNVWVEDGDLLIYLSRSGTFDELNGMPKLGRLRVRFDPNPFGTEAVEFRQELRLREGDVVLQAKVGEVDVRLEVWVDVNRPVAHVVAHSSAPISLVATYENWRMEPREQGANERGANRSYQDAPEPAVVRPDVVEFVGEAVRFYHRNEGRTAFDLVVEQQGLDPVKDELWNPLEHLTFGGELSGAGLVPDGTVEGVYASTPYRGWRLRSERAATDHALQVTMHVAQAPSLEEWVAGLAERVHAAAIDPARDRQATQAWWAQFWDRSHVFIDEPIGSPAWQVGRNYQVFRYQLGTNARGDYPTKFNGGLFTVDPEFTDPQLPFSPDYRRWGGGSFTAQNQRLVYWPMLASGDFDMMRPQFEFYRRALGNAEMRSREYWGIDGASFTEQIENFGLPVAYEYNWHRSAEALPGIEDSDWVNYQWDTVFEFCGMILETHRYAGADVRDYLPLIESCLHFYDAFYQAEAVQRTGRPLDDDGKLILFPGTANETYKDALNPTSTLAALRGVLTGLLALPADQLPNDRRGGWERMLARLPEIGRRDVDGHEVIAPAWSWSRVQNVELPQLYPVYPWRQYGVGQPDLQVARNTWHYGFDRPDQKQIVSWHQDAIFCARLGLTAEAAELTLQKMGDSGRRFPTWWGPGHDWVPDHNWGGSGMIGVQEMLLQPVGDALYLLPAWPVDWDVDFKLHAPGQTTVEARLVDGRLEHLQVTPASRAKDVVLPDWVRR
ncbi:DUF5703 domain-containing protein [Actomonas aquatica]|uniref:DUF5703 domain-containing protein n=1 Tax=Actomonas aquatica TaxID=2866162 RepID=A0ABZ1C2Y6_9BACT|nr:DUF5703 domain-containing protein [Opitutus sp. WL0086]WRQ85909.1 DUF5703 domain-containing protein [Opitutus sp. WL0086]